MIKEGSGGLLCLTKVRFKSFSLINVVFLYVNTEARVRANSNYYIWSILLLPLFLGIY